MCLLSILHPNSRSSRSNEPYPAAFPDSDTRSVFVSDAFIKLINPPEQRIIALEEENYRLQETVQMCVDDMTANAARKDSIKSESAAPGLKKQPSLKWAPYKGSRSPTKADHESPSGSPLAPEHHIPVCSLFACHSQSYRPSIACKACTDVRQDKSHLAQGYSNRTHSVHPYQQ